MTTLSESGYKRREAKQEKKRKSARLHLSKPRRRIKPADRAYDVFTEKEQK